MNILSIIKVEIHMLVEWPTQIGSPNHFIIEPEIVSIFGHVVQSHLNTCLFGVCS